MKSPRVLLNDKVKGPRLKNLKGKVTPFDLPKRCKARCVLVHYAQNCVGLKATDELCTCILVLLALICVLCFRLCRKLVIVSSTKQNFKIRIG